MAAKILSNDARIVMGIYSQNTLFGSKDQAQLLWAKFSIGASSLARL